MNAKQKNIVLLCLLGTLLFGLSLWSWLRPADRYSASERRALASRPALTADSFLSGRFMQDFEDYALDQFPCRDRFRSLKALTSLYAFAKADNNDLFLTDGHISKLNYPLKPAMLDHAAQRFAYLRETYLDGTDCKLYFSIVPDKNRYLAAENGYLSLDYDALVQAMREKTEEMRYIDLFDLLSADHYYRTDTHWRQETLLPVAERLLRAMDAPVTADYREVTLDQPFYGVYVGQSALPLQPDRLTYLTNDMLEHCTVTSYDTGKPVAQPLYDLDKADSADPYELFLCGADPLVVVENPDAATDRELVIFRDSFGSSLAPLLVGSYAKVTLVDIRYLQSSYLGSFLDFTDQDVLFLYSTLLLNDSLALK